MAKQQPGAGHNSGASSVSAAQLRSFIERVERLEEEKKSIAEDIKSVFAEAKSQGFDTKTMKSIVRLRAMDEHQRREYEALLDIYKAALGMLDGTPLGNWAVEKIKDAAPETSAKTPTKQEIKEAAKPDVTPEQAREMGKEAAQNGWAITANPFPARDARRSAWDEAWCSQMGSDGMDIPNAWSRKKPKKDEGQEGGDQESPSDDAGDDPAPGGADKEGDA